MKNTLKLTLLILLCAANLRGENDFFAISSSGFQSVAMPSVEEGEKQSGSLVSFYKYRDLRHSGMLVAPNEVSVSAFGRTKFLVAHAERNKEGQPGTVFSIYSPMHQRVLERYRHPNALADVLIPGAPNGKRQTVCCTPDNVVWFVVRDREGYIMVGLDWETKTEIFKEGIGLMPPFLGVSGDDCIAVTDGGSLKTKGFSSEVKILVGSKSGPTKRSFSIRYSAKESIQPLGSITSALFGPDGKVCLGLSRGNIIELDLSNETSTVHAVLSSLENNANKEIYDMCQLGDGKLAVGISSEGGNKIYIYDSNNAKVLMAKDMETTFTAITSRDGKLYCTGRDIPFIYTLDKELVKISEQPLIRFNRATFP